MGSMLHGIDAAGARAEARAEGEYVKRADMLGFFAQGGQALTTRQAHFL